MILTDEEIWQIGMQDISLDAPYGYARAIESAVLEKLKAQEPVAWRYRFGNVWMFDTYRLNGCDADEAVPVFTNPLPPADVVRDAERYRWLRERGCGPTLEESVLVIKGSDPEYSLLPDELDAAIDAAMKEMK